MLSFPFKKKRASNNYHNLDSELRSQVQTPPKNFVNAQEIAHSKSPQEKSLKDSNLAEKFDLEQETAAGSPTRTEHKREEIELTTINLENTSEKFCRLGLETTASFQKQIFEEATGFEKVFEDERNPHHLKIFLKSYVIEKRTRINIVRSEWLAPCKPEELLEIMNNIEEQKKIANGSIDQFFSYESFGDAKNFNLMYLKYKRILMASPRDFVYLKCCSVVNREKNAWVDCSVSVNDDRFPEIKGETVRGNIIISGTYLEEVGGEELVGTKVISYSEIDFKLNLPLGLTKPTTVSEFKRYVEKTCEIVKNSNKNAGNNN